MYLKLNLSILCSCKSLHPAKRGTARCGLSHGPPPQETGSGRQKVWANLDRAPLKMWVPRVGEIAGGVSPSRAISPGSLLHWNQHSQPLATGPLGTSPSSQLPWGAAIFLFSYYNSILMRLPPACLCSAMESYMFPCAACAVMFGFI